MANKAGRTPMFYAATCYNYNYADIIRLLINAGADVTQTNNDGDTPLDIATRLGNADIMTILT